MIDNSNGNKSHKKINSEIAIQYSGSVDENNTVELGNKLGAQYIVYGTYVEGNENMNLSIYIVDVEKAQNLLTCSYKVRIDDTIRSKLGDKKKMVNVQDYISAMNRRYRQQLDTEAEIQKTIRTKTDEITKKYKTQIDEVKKRERLPYEKPDVFEATQKKDITEIEKKRDKEIDDMSENENQLLTKQISDIDEEIKEIENKLLNATFSLGEKDLAIEFGEFYVGSGNETQYWPFTVKSLNKVLDYEYNGKFEVTDLTVRQLYPEIEAAKKQRTFTGELKYVVVNSVKSNEYDFIVKSIIIKNGNKTLVNEEPNNTAKNTVFVTPANLSGVKFDLSRQLVSIPGKNFKMLKTEVAQKLYTSVMGENPSSSKGDNLPAENMSYYDVIVFCNKLSEKCGKTPVYSVAVSSGWSSSSETDTSKWNYKIHSNDYLGTISVNSSADGFRLPTSDEWIYAARGGQNFAYPGSDDKDSVAWSDENTHSVATKLANGYGLYDMYGNVREYCYGPLTRVNDYYDGTYYACDILGSIVHEYWGSDSYAYSVDKTQNAKSRSATVGFRVVCKD